MNRKERRAARAEARRKQHVPLTESDKQAGHELRTQLLEHHKTSALESAGQRATTESRGVGDFMGIVLDLRDVAARAWAAALGMNDATIRASLEDAGALPSAVGLAYRDSAIGRLAEEFPMLSEMAEGIPRDFLPIVCIAARGASLIGLRADGSDSGTDVRTLPVDRVDAARSSEGEEN
jgi:hypothetical protein